jgi:hypothetical protein
MEGQQQPLTDHHVPEVLRCLSEALSGGNHSKAAEAVLGALEQCPNFCTCLALIMADGQLDYSARWLASVHFKNTVVRNWRRLGVDEKARLRSAVLQLVGQEDNQVAIQVALALAKIARADFPHEWPELFDRLLALLLVPSQPYHAASSPGASSSSPAGVQLITRRVYLVLHHLLKELSSKRLPADRKNFHGVANKLLAELPCHGLPSLWDQWLNVTQVRVFTATLRPSSAPTMATDQDSTPPTCIDAHACMRTHM